jgi:hypothetical protein
MLFAVITLGLLSPSRGPEAATRQHGVSHPPTSRVFTLLDYFRNGRSAVDNFLGSDLVTDAEEDLPAIIARCQRACARVEVRFLQTTSTYKSIHGSGVLVDGGRKILTAGHALENDNDLEILVTFHNGEVRTARIAAREYLVHSGASQDWAVMELLGPPVTSVPSVELDEAAEGGLAIVLGYPDQIGVNTSGEIAYMGTGGFLPLVTLSTVLQRDPLVLSPTAGSIPVGGMSGGPIFDRHGRLVGIFVSVSRIVQSNEVRYFYNGAPLKNLPLP